MLASYASIFIMEKENIMAGSSSVTDITVADPAWDISFRLIDASGDIRTVTIQRPAGSAPSTAEIKAAQDALQAASNASIFEVALNSRWIGPKDVGIADDSTYLSVYDNVVINYKDEPARKQQSAYIPSPVGELVQGGDRVDAGNSLYTAVRDAYDVLLAGDFAAVTVRFTERREKNDSVPAF